MMSDMNMRFANGCAECPPDPNSGSGFAHFAKSTADAALTAEPEQEEFTMKIKLKPLDQQVMVITGASSGIGLAAAESAAKKGAKLVLAGRSGETLDDVVRRITADGGEAISVTCDVALRADVERLAQTAISRFGRIDTLVNDAGLAS